MASTKYLIIGSGAAGVSAAKKIRQCDNDGEIAIFTDDKRPLFSKPRLPEFLAGDCSENDLETYKPVWYEKQRIQIRTETVVKGIIPGDKVVVTADNARHAYDKLLIATGSHPTRLPISGFDSDHVYTVRTIDDVITLRSVAKAKKCCIVLGGGLLGIEIAHALSKLGASVTVAEYYNRLIPRQLDEEGSQLLKEVLENSGLQFMLGTQATAIENHNGEKQLVVQGRDPVSCGFIVMSVGISPAVQLARDAGLSTHKGIIADDFLRTSHEGIFTAGDCAEHNGIIYGLWSAAMEQGEIAGENMVGASRKYLGTTVATQLKVAGIEVASVGAIEYNDKTVSAIKKIDAKSGCYKKIFLRDKRVLGAILIGCNKEALKIKQLIKDKTVIEVPEALL
jgi:nitrite reductase (NADH) large subunit